MFKRALTFFLTFALSTYPALAENEIDCSAECSDGTVKVSYADGENLTCSCIEYGDTKKQESKVSEETLSSAKH